MISRTRHESVVGWSRELLIAALVVLGMTGVLRAQDGIVLRGSVRLNADQLQVRLADVADLHGSVAQALGASVVFETRSIPSRPVTIGVDVIRDRLVELEANLGLVALSGRDCVMRWRSPAAVAEPQTESSQNNVERLDRPGFADQYAHEGTLRSVVSTYLARNLLGRELSDVQLRFRAEDAEVLDRSARGYDYEIKPLASRLSSTIPLLVNAFEGPRVVQSTRLIVEVAIRQRVLIVQRYIARGEIIQPGDLIEEVRVIDPQVSQPHARLEEVLGMEARGRLIPGEILKQGDTVSQVVLARNSEVWVRARHGMFVIRMRARVLDEGRVGEYVRVQRLGDRVQLKGIVGPDGEITVDTGADWSMEVSR